MYYTYSDFGLKEYLTKNIAIIVTSKKYKTLYSILNLNVLNTLSI